MRTNRLTFTLFPVLLFISLAFFAHAQSDSANPDNEGQGVDPEVVQGERAEERATREEEREATLTLNRQQRIINLAANISNQLDASIRRLTNITNRLDDRITKLKLEGVDTAEAEALLAEAKELLKRSFIRMITIDTDIYNAVTSETPVEAWQDVRDMLLEVRRDLLDLQALLRDIVASLRVAIEAADDADLSNMDAVTDNEPATGTN